MAWLGKYYMVGAGKLKAWHREGKFFVRLGGREFSCSEREWTRTCKLFGVKNEIVNAPTITPEKWKNHNTCFKVA